MTQALGENQLCRQAPPPGCQGNNLGFSWVLPFSRVWPPPTFPALVHLVCLGQP